MQFRVGPGPERRGICFAGRPGLSGRSRRRSALTGDRGAVAVEFALLLLPLVLIIFGITDFGRAYNQELSLSAAAREGVRTMALQDSPTLARAAVRAATPQLSPALTDAQITVSPATCAIGTTVTVTVKYRLSSLSGYFTGMFSGKQLTGVGVMRCSG